MEDKISNILIKVEKGENLTLEESELLKKFSESSENRQILDDYKALFDLTNQLKEESLPSFNTDEEWLNFKQLVKPKTRKLSLKWMSAAASIIIVASLSFLLLFQAKNNTTIIQANAKKTEHILPDGSTIYLNKFASIEYAKGFGKEHRNLLLKGEAFFEVKKSTTPFTIETPQEVFTQVLGTSFNLNAPISNSNVELMVISGKVAFGTKDNMLNNVYIKGESAVFNTNTQKIAEHQKATSNASAWHTGSFIFKDTPLHLVAKELEAYLNTSIKLPKSSTHKKFSGQFNAPNIEEVAETIALALGLKYEINSSDLTFIEQE